LKAQGVLGLGRKKDSEIGSTMLDSMIRAGIISKNIFSIYLNEFEDDD